ncbi:hypothetical protein L226DRAFT_386856 [Lentinus tigrinus ALCF2SS1-7]|uniref:BTB domain-containing protein n=1 Tax=Lentinus tigrinus ALCF2SS1-6 TaxID=1328759 RepID=A0A5C2S9F5_9APHY|nr:hypothetical protein L227DRAFT_88316 [Lentinus tigrinus ALCF2SS1-6]RPD75739.1 hypothetical protein L226DRAFT_386856 [Lentinus tigrinus ALCF2SS1-7]
MQPAHTSKRAFETQPISPSSLKRPKLEPDIDTLEVPVSGPIPGPVGPGRWLGSRDHQFWYSDGNIVIRLEGVLFKLHRSRLERYCTTFCELFATKPDGDETIDGCPAYEAPPELSLQGFKDVLAVLEEPLIYANRRPSQLEAISVLRASETLQCWQPSRLAKTWLSELWDANAIPSADRSDAHSVQDAILMVQLSRTFDIPGVLKRALYELVSSQDFWDTFAKDRPSIALAEEDLTLLLAARIALAEMWQDFVFDVPSTNKGGRSLCLSGLGFKKHGPCSRSLEGGRMASWAGSVLRGGHLKSGARDPLRYNVVERGKEDLKLMWCDACLQEKEVEWKAKRVEWWGELDKVFKLERV